MKYGALNVNVFVLIWKNRTTNVILVYKDKWSASKDLAKEDMTIFNVCKFIPDCYDQPKTLMFALLFFQSWVLHIHVNNLLHLRELFLELKTTK